MARFMNNKMTETQLMDNGLPHNLHNPYQGKYKRVLCVCTGGILRSATAAWWLGRGDYNTRACGLRSDVSLVPISRRLLEWPDKIICFEAWHLNTLRALTDKPIYCLGIEDGYEYRDKVLIRLMLRETGFYQ